MALDRNTEESADESYLNNGILGNIAKEEDIRGDNLFQKSNNPTLSARKSEFYKEVDQRMDNIAQVLGLDNVIDEWTGLPRI
jgi:hypothetical protein